MATNSETTSTLAADTVTNQFREIADRGAKQSKEVFEKIGSATTEAAEVLADCCSTALHGVQDYNSKLVEFTEENTKSTLELLKNVATVKSPSEFIEVTAEHARRRLETMAEQSKLLAELAQRVTLKTTEPIKTGIANAFRKAA